MGYDREEWNNATEFADGLCVEGLIHGFMQTESAEDEAKARKWGLWADPNPINPYDWRKGRR